MIKFKEQAMKIKHRYDNDEAFGSAVREFIEDLEGSKPKIYLDSQNKPTIGIGYLIEKDEWESEFVNAGINLNRDQVARINKLLDDILYYRKQPRMVKRMLLKHTIEKKIV